MSLRWFRKYQKKLLWPFAIVIIVTFGVTGIMAQVLSGTGEPAWAKVFGEEMTSSRFQSLLDRLKGFIPAAANKFQCRDIVIPALTTKNSLADVDWQELTWNYIKYQKEADRLGITVSDCELQEFIQNKFIDTVYYNSELGMYYDEYSKIYDNNKAYEEALKRVNMNWDRATERQKREMRNLQYWSAQDYVQYVHQAIGADKVLAFEMQLKELVRIKKLFDLALSSAAAGISEAYDYYRGDFQERSFGIYVFDSRDYYDDVNITAKEYQDYLMRNADNFKRGRSVDVEYVFADRNKIKKDVEKNFKPSDKELNAYFNRNKRFWRDHEAEKTARKKFNEAEQKKKKKDPNYKIIKYSGRLFKKLADVRDDVLKRMISEKIGSRINKMFVDFQSTVDMEIKMLADMGMLVSELEFKAVETIAESIGLEAGRILEARRGDRFMLEDTGEISGFEKKAFALEPYEFSGSIKSENGEVSYRVVKRRKEALPPYDEIRDELRGELTRQKAVELAKDAAGKYSRSLRDNTAPDDVEATFYMKTPLIRKANRGGRLADLYLGPDIVTGPQGRENPGTGMWILNEGFGLDNTGDVSDPVAAMDGRQFVVEFIEERDPQPDGFFSYSGFYMGVPSTVILDSLSYEKRRDLFVEWKKLFDKRANLTFLDNEGNPVKDKKEGGAEDAPTPVEADR